MPSDSTSVSPTPDDIARLAYSRYEARGKVSGFDLEDWLAAEQEARLRQSGTPDPEPDAAGPAASPLDGIPIESSRPPGPTA